MEIKVHLNFWEEEFGTPFQENQSELSPVTFPETGSFELVEITGARNFPSFVFVDGVMRQETSLTFEIEGELVRGTLFTLGAGALLTENGKINLLEQNLLDYHMEKVLLVDSPQKAGTIGKWLQNRFRNLPVGWETLTNIRIESCNPGMESTEAVNQVRKLEGEVVDRAIEKIGPETLLITDGTLHYPTYPRPVVGYIKSIHRPYPGREEFQKNRELACGKTRSGIFEIQEKQPRYSWYISLTSQLGWVHSLARLEVYRNLPLERAKEIADLTAVCLPAFVMEHIPRYPQNLGPVKALENELRMRMGNKILMKNMLMEYLS